MIEYYIKENPDDRVIKRAVDLLESSAIIVFPTETNWVLAVSPHSKEAIKKLYKLKGMEESKHLSLLCNSLSQASSYAIITDAIFSQIKNRVNGPYTFILPPNHNLPKGIREYRKAKEIGIRISPSNICQCLIKLLNSPILITSLAPSMLNLEISSNELYGYLIEERLGHEVSLILDPGDLELNGPSTVVSFAQEGEGPRVLRVGAGSPSPFL